MIKVGLQACSSAEQFLMDPLQTIEAIAAIGYRYIETAGNMFTEQLKTPPNEIRKHFEYAGIEHVAKHFSFVSMANAEKDIELLKLIGGKYVVLASDYYESLDNLLAKCDLFNRIGKRCAEEGLEFVYHNHAHEFQLFGNKPALETIRENTDPELVHFELDAMWILRGGYDPVEVIKTFGKRVKLLHLSDFHSRYRNAPGYFDGLDQNIPITRAFNAEHNINVSADIGEGIMDIQSILDAANQYASVDYGFIELSGSNSIHKDNMLKAAEFGYNALKKYNGVEL